VFFAVSADVTRWGTFLMLMKALVITAAAASGIGIFSATPWT
jgi:hypothetical protein